MIIAKHRQLYYKQKGFGLGYINKEIIDPGIGGIIQDHGLFTDTMKILYKKLWTAGKTLFKNKVLSAKKRRVSSDPRKMRKEHIFWSLRTN
jgi:hypothetical protein